MHGGIEADVFSTPVSHAHSVQGPAWTFIREIDVVEVRIVAHRESICLRELVSRRQERILVKLLLEG